MKKLLFIAFLSLLTSTLYAQAPLPLLANKISGVVIDSLSKDPVDYATVALMKWGENKAVNGDMTDDKGKFTLREIPSGDYQLVVSFIGYATYMSKKITVDENGSDLNLGTILLKSVGTRLEEVVVVGQRPLIENKIDKLVYNADQDVTSKGGDASDVLRKVPMVDVDIDGNVSMRGSEDVKVLINGKPSSMTASSVADAMKMIPADQIKNIEVITSPSAKYDAEGTAGIINIITKKTNASGLTGSVGLSGGTRRNNGNLSLNWRSGKWGATAGVRGMYMTPSSGSSIIRNHNFRDPEHESFLNQDGTSRNKRYGGGANFGLTYDPTKTSSISSTVSVNSFNNNPTSNQRVDNRGFVFDEETKLITDVPFTELYTRSNERTSSNNGIDWSTDYLKTFTKPKQELSFGFQLSNSKSQTDNTTVNEVEETYLQGIQSGANSSRNNGNTREMTLQGDYAQPLSEKILLEFGAKGIERKISSDSRYTLFDPILNGNKLDPMRPPLSFDYTQRVYAGYTTLGFTLPAGFGLKAGARIERTEINWDFPTEHAPSTKNSYNNVIPSATLSKNLTDRSSLRLSYSKRIQRPSLRVLNPYVDQSDSKNISMGNPDLTPELTDNFEIGYSSSFGQNSTVNTSVYYRNTNDEIQSIVNPGLQADTYITTYENVAGSFTLGMNIFGSTKLFDKLSLRANVNLFHYEASDARYKSNNNNNLVYNMNLNGSWSLPEGFAVEAFGFFNSPRRTVQGTNPSFSMFSFGAKKDILNKKGTIGINVANPFNKYRYFKRDIIGEGFTNFSETAIPFRSVGISFNYSFGKMDYSGQKKQRKRKGINNDDSIQDNDPMGN